MVIGVYDHDQADGHHHDGHAHDGHGHDYGDDYDNNNGINLQEIAGDDDYGDDDHDDHHGDKDDNDDDNDVDEGHGKDDVY